MGVKLPDFINFIKIDEINMHIAARGPLLMLAHGILCNIGCGECGG